MQRHVLERTSNVPHLVLVRLPSLTVLSHTLKSLPEKFENKLEKKMC